MSQTINAIVFNAPNEVTTGQFELGPCGPTDIVVRTLYTMVSSGTELRVLGGHYGSAGHFPLIPGYSVIGEVTAVGEKSEGYRVGDLISGRNPRPVPGVGAYWGGQASHHVYATTGEDRVVHLPAGAKPLDYVIAEISAISLRGVVGAAPREGETAIVLGQGLIGAFSAAWLHSYGCRVIVADLEQARLDRAYSWGASAAVKIGEPDAEARLIALCNGGADIVVESSGTAAGAMMAYRLLRRKPQRYGSEYKVEPIQFYHNDWPRLVMQANYLDSVTVNPFSFVPGEAVTILAPKDRGVEDRQHAVELIRRGRIRATDFVQKVAPYTQAPSAYAALRDDKNSNFSLVFDWTGQS